MIVLLPVIRNPTCHRCKEGPIFDVIVSSLYEVDLNSYGHRKIHCFQCNAEFPIERSISIRPHSNTLFSTIFFECINHSTLTTHLFVDSNILHPSPKIREVIRIREGLRISPHLL